MAELPSGTVTFVFTDIEGSTRLLNALGPVYEEVLAAHRKLLRAAFRAHDGVEVDTQGDAFFYAFSRARDALLGAVAAQRALASYPWPGDTELRVRMGIHTGEPVVTDEGYVGADVHLGARICAVAWGEQMLLSEATTRLIADRDTTTRDLGEHSLKDIESPVRLHQVIAPELRADFPPPRTMSSRPNNLPPGLDPLVGRTEEIGALTSLLVSSTARVVTLTGPGGVGKTRLSLAVGAELLPWFEDGVFFVDLSALSDPAFVSDTIAFALGLREGLGRSLAETLSDYLGSRHILLVLDNFEHLLDAAADISALVSSGPAVTVLTTSREALHIAGEHEVPLAPLGLPPVDAGTSEVRSAPAVELFLTRARALRPSFELTGDDASSVAAICRRLDGLPLAIELAASRTKVLSLSALASRLDQSLASLGHGRRDVSVRQRTLRGTIEWSYELLSPDEQALFRRLGVFVGGWTVEAAESVCDRGDAATDVLGGLASLVDKSLVRALDHEDRFVMLETIRSFAADELEASGEAQDIHQAHADYFCGLAEQAEPHLFSEDQKVHLDRLNLELGNLRTALAMLHRVHDSQAQLRMTVALRHFWRLRGYLTEGRSRLTEALAIKDGDSALVAQGLGSLGLIAYFQGDYATARSSIQASLALSADIGLKDRVASALSDLGMISSAEGDLGSAQALYEESLSKAREMNDPLLIAHPTHNLADLALRQGAYERAHELASASLSLWREVGDNEGIAVALMNSAFAEIHLGRFSEAVEQLRSSLTMAGELGFQVTIAACLDGFAAIAHHHGEDRKAIELLVVADDMRQLIGAVADPFERSVHDDMMNAAASRLQPNDLADSMASGHEMDVEAATALAFGLSY